MKKLGYTLNFTIFLCDMNSILVIDDLDEGGL
jgi:hypothetical protein